MSRHAWSETTSSSSAASPSSPKPCWESSKKDSHEADRTTYTRRLDAKFWVWEESKRHLPFSPSAFSSPGNSREFTSSPLMLMYDWVERTQNIFEYITFKVTVVCPVESSGKSWLIHNILCYISNFQISANTLWAPFWAKGSCPKWRGWICLGQR